MPQENRASLIATFELGIRSLLLPKMIVGVAVAQNPVPLVNQPLVPDTKVPGGAGFTLTVNGSNFVSGSETASWIL